MGEDVQKPKSKPSRNAGGNVKRCSRHVMLWQFLKEFNTDSPCDSATLLPSTYPGELKTGIQINAFSQMFTGAACVIARRWKQPKCPPMMWTNKSWSTHTKKYYSATKGRKY